MTLSTKITVANNWVGDCISVLKTINNDYLLAYTINNSIQIYDLLKRCDIKTLDNIGHRIHKVHHYLDSLNKRDLLLTVSEINIKIWNIMGLFKYFINNRLPSK